jgi:uncharacterized membrane protein YhaH (DUF805 family)
MTKRRQSHQQQHHRQGGEYQYGTETSYRGRKSLAEERTERLTWFLLVLIFAIMNVLLEGGVNLPNWFVPLSGGVVLIGSGIYQYARRWRVSPTTWLAGALLAGLAIVNLEFSPNRSFLGISLIVFAGVILIGLVTGET